MSSSTAAFVAALPCKSGRPAILRTYRHHAATCTAAGLPKTSPPTPKTSKSRTSAASLKSAAQAIDGEWFGYEASFSCYDSSPMEIEERYVPEEFRNWGQSVKGFEEVCSTRVRNEDGAEPHLYVKRTRALPSVGCEADAVVPEVRVDRYLVTPNAPDIEISEYAIRGNQVGGVALAFENGAFSAGPATFSQEVAARWDAWIPAADSESRSRARLDFGLVNEVRGKVTAFVETHDGTFCDGELLPGCGGKNRSFADDEAVTDEELSGEWVVQRTEMRVVDVEEGVWEESASSYTVNRTVEQVKNDVNIRMPKGLTIGMVETGTGGMNFVAGWLSSAGKRSTVGREYNKEGLLVSVSSSLEVRASS